MEKNVLSKNRQLIDESIDQILRIVRETSCFETQSVQYVEYPDLITACYNKSVQIIVGNCTKHWRCVFFNGVKLHVYDSIPGCTYKRLVAEEKDILALVFHR